MGPLRDLLNTRRPQQPSLPAALALIITSLSLATVIIVCLLLLRLTQLQLNAPVYEPSSTPFRLPCALPLSLASNQLHILVTSVPSPLSLLVDLACNQTDKLVVSFTPNLSSTSPPPDPLAACLLSTTSPQLSPRAPRRPRRPRTTAKTTPCI
ncbi:hypothetical protein PtB15_5B94 [Puccinia triticina]|nr:hypothetical protein PtB15_5B94 [Puccinia triticina]